jgi:hypothetical protein
MEVCCACPSYNVFEVPTSKKEFSRMKEMV